MDEYEDFDTAAAAKDIGDSLFSAKPADEIVPLDSVENPAPEVVADKPSSVEKPIVEPVPGTNEAPGIVPGQNSVGKTLPKSWKKDLAPEWEKLSPAVKDYVYEREANVMRGIQQYQGGYQAWDTLIKPFAPLLEQNPEVNPVQLMQGLMHTHLQLMNPSADPQSKIALVTALLNEYGITLNPGDGPAPDAALIARLQKAETALQSLESQGQQVRQQAFNSGVETHFNAITKFAADPANKYYPEVENDILHLVKTGAATDLASAYEKACWLNPTVRQKMLVEQQAKPAPTKDKPRGKDGQFVNLDTDTNPRTRAVKKGSIDDTINSVVASHFTKH